MTVSNATSIDHSLASPEQVAAYRPLVFISKLLAGQLLIWSFLSVLLLYYVKELQRAVENFGLNTPKSADLLFDFAAWYRTFAYELLTLGTMIIVCEVYLFLRCPELMSARDRKRLALATVGVPGMVLFVCGSTLAFFFCSVFLKLFSSLS